MRPVTKLILLIGLLGLAACPKKPKYPACNGDKDCKEGEKCFNKMCAQCATNEDCPKGQQCTGGSCEAIPGYCEQSTDCPTGEVCVNNECTGCTDDAQCADTTGGKCINGKCQDPKYCEDDTWCAEDEDCVDGLCTKAAAETPTECDLTTVYFGYDEFTLTDETKSTLDSNAECLKGKGGNVKVLGHADPRGTVEYNISLSDKRAQAVINYIKGRVGSTKLKKVPMGESEASGSDEDGWALDRKVEFK